MIYYLYCAILILVICVIKPDWIFFDYGETLIHEKKFDSIAGNRRLLEIASENPRGATLDDVRRIADEITEISHKVKHGLDVEMYSPAVQRLIFENLGVKFSIPWEKVDEEFWDASAPGSAMPGAAEALNKARDLGIRTAVISNMGFHAETLRRRLDRLLPGNALEFIITSSQYALRKPHKLIFGAALTRSGARNAWYVGDNLRCDLLGASDAGLYPVWISAHAPQEEVARVHTRISCIGELVNLLDLCDAPQR